MHAAKLNKSDRLRRVLRVLKTHKRPLTTREVMDKSNTCALSACISELREQGKDIKCWRVGGLWYYLMVK